MHYIGKEEAELVGRVIESQDFSRYRGGPNGFSEKFEQNWRKKIGVKHCVTVNSGTSALICAMAGMGIGPGDEVIVPAYTWIATALAPLAVGAVPILADIDESLTIDPKDIERKITKHTKAIIPVHMANFPCDMTAIMKIARKHKLMVCEDACQAVGVPYGKNQRLGTIGDAGACSFNIFKNLTCGEGGLMMTDNDRIYERGLIYHDVGAFARAQNVNVKTEFFAGVNYRVSNMQGAMMFAQLKRLDTFMRGLKSRRAAMAKIIEKAKSPKLAPHHDPANAVALALVFDSAEELDRYVEGQPLGLMRPINSGLHVYTKWTPLMEQRAFDPRMDPWKWAKRKIKYTPDMCQRTLDIMARTAIVSFAYDEPLPAVRKRARQIAERARNI